MMFVRLAGCNVGRYIGADQAHSVCTAWNGTEFTCDTDYHARDSMDVEEIAEEIAEGHVCITGGEPFIHDLRPLVNALANKSKATHIETSGTKMVDSVASTWITCSPKQGFLAENALRIDEWKFVVDTREDLKAVQAFVTEHHIRRRVYIQPVNPVNTTRGDMEDFIKMIVETNPGWRLSPQVHKLLGLR